MEPTKSTPFFRLGPVLLAPTLSTYCQWSFDLGIFSQAFETAKVNPIFKSGSREILGNYRPIALLSNLSKILQKRIKIRFDILLSTNKVLYANQYGFKNNYNVNHALLYVVTTYYDAVHCSQHTAFARRLIECHTKSYCISYTITAFADPHVLNRKITLPLEANL